MRNIDIEEDFHQELLQSIKTSLIHTGIEILEYYKEGELEFIKLDFPFTTTGNILTYRYKRQTKELSLIGASVYSINEDKMAVYEELVDRDTILKLYGYCRKQAKIYLDKKTEQIYDTIITGKTLTEEELISQGFTNEDITMLLEFGYIKETSAKEYTISRLDKFYRYGLKLLLLNNAENARKARNCFLYCYQQEPNNRDFCLQLLLIYVKLEKYDEAFKLLSHVEEISTPKYQSDNNLYLFMLSQLTTCPPQYQERVQQMQLGDVMIPYDCRYPRKPEHNKIRATIMRYKYKYAMKLLNDIISEDITYTVSQELLKQILTNLIVMEDKFSAKLLHIATSKQYGVIIVHIRDKKRKQNITEKCICLICEDLLEITKTKQIPPVTITDTSLISEAIEGRNYQLAQELNMQFLKEHRKNPEEDILNILLTHINDLISRIRENKDVEILKVSSAELPNDCSEIEKYAEELAYYLNSEKLTIEASAQTYNLNPEQVQLIKLIHARDFYTTGLYPRGDLLIQEVEVEENKSAKVISLLNEIKANRMEYHKNIKPYVRRKEKPSQAPKKSE